MTKPPAMPELPEPDRTMWQHGKQIDHYTADQMRAYALATLQAQPAEVGVSDEDIWRLWDSQDSPELSGGPCPVKFARAILALQSAQPAVPLTAASRAVIMATRTADGDADEWPEPWAYRRGWNDAEEHHHIRPNAEAK